MECAASVCPSVRNCRSCLRSPRLVRSHSSRALDPEAACMVADNDARAPPDPNPGEHPLLKNKPSGIPDDQPELAWPLWAWMRLDGGRCQPNLARFCPTSARARPKFGDVGRCWALLRPMLIRVRSTPCDADTGGASEASLICERDSAESISRLNPDGVQLVIDR